MGGESAAASTPGKTNSSGCTTTSLQTQSLPEGRAAKGNVLIAKNHWPAFWVLRALRRVLYEGWNKSNIRVLTKDPGSALQVVEEWIADAGHAFSWEEWFDEEGVTDASLPWAECREYVGNRPSTS